ncbi:retrovirus-related pol polyprotein from transposon TNT 1-94 [Tanacetum coccineum]
MNVYESLFDPLIPDLEDTADLQDTGIFGSAYDDEYVGAKANFNNMETNMSVSPIPTTRIHKDHPKAQIIGEVDSVVQTRRMHKQNEAGLITFINKQRRTNHKDFQNCLFACFLSQMEPKKVTQALDDENCVEAMQDKLLQFKLLNVWTLVDLPNEKKVIGTKWVFRNKRDQRGIVVRNKARLVAQGHRQEKGIDYNEVFASAARIEAIRLFLAFASFMGFTMYQMDLKSAFLYGTIEEEAPRAWYETLSTYLLENRFRRGTIDKTLFIKKIKNDILLVQVYVDDIIFGSTKESLSLQVEQRKNGIFLSQDKYMHDILKKFGFSSVKTASTPMETHKPLLQDSASTDVDVQPKASHMHVVKRIFRYLKGQPTLGLWYPKDSPIDLIAYSDSDYAGASIDRKYTTEAEYIAASNYCGQVLWLQNQLLDYGYNFMKTKIHMDNKSAICVVKNPVYHSKTKHIEIRHHFIRDSYEKKLIEMVKIHTNNNVADLLTKAFDVTRFQFLSASIGKSKEVETLRYLSLVVPLIKVGDEAVHKELGDIMERVATTASSFEAEQDRGSGPRHNMVAYLEKPEGSAEFHQIIDFLTTSYIHYALTKNPPIYASFIKQFWTTATASTNVNGEVELTASIDGQANTITEASLRRHMKLEDNGGITSLPNTEIFEQLALMGCSILDIIIQA